MMLMIIVVGCRRQGIAFWVNSLTRTHSRRDDQHSHFLGNVEDDDGNDKTTETFLTHSLFVDYGGGGVMIQQLLYRFRLNGGSDDDRTTSVGVHFGAVAGANGEERDESSLDLREEPVERERGERCENNHFDHKLEVVVEVWWKAIDLAPKRRGCVATPIIVVAIMIHDYITLRMHTMRVRYTNTLHRQSGRHWCRFRPQSYTAYTNATSIDSLCSFNSYILRNTPVHYFNKHERII